MARFEGEKDFALPPSEIRAKLMDARFLAQCIPDVESIKDAKADRAEVLLRPGFSFVRGTLDVTLRVVDAVESSARYDITSKGIGSSADVTATAALSPHDNGTRVRWTAEVTQLGGLLKMVPAGLIDGAAERVIHDVWNAVEAKLSAS